MFMGQVGELPSASVDSSNTRESAVLTTAAATADAFAAAVALTPTTPSPTSIA